MSRTRIYSIMMLLIAALVVAVVFINVSLNTIYIGVDLNKTSEGKWIVSYTDRQGWGAHNGIRVGDQMLQIDGANPDQHSTIKFNSIEQAKSIEVIRDGRHIIVSVDEDFNSTKARNNLRIPIIIFLVLYLFSLFLFIKARKDSSAHLLILFFMTTALCYLGSMPSGMRFAYAQVFVAIALTLVPILLLNFLYSYFIKYNIKVLNPKLIYGFYGINSLFFIFVVASIYTDFGYKVHPSLVANGSLLLFSFGYIYMIYILVTRYIQFRKTIYNPIFKYMIIGNLLSFFPFIFLYALPRLLFNEIFLSAYVAAIGLLLFPIVYVYLVVSKKLLDIDFIIDRLRYYCWFAILPSLIISLSLFLFVDFSRFTLAHFLFAFIIVYIMIVILLYVKERLESPLNTTPFKKKLNFQLSLNQFSEQIRKVNKQADLEDLIIQEVTRMLPISSAAIIEVDNEYQCVEIRKESNQLPDVKFIELTNQTSRTHEIGELLNLNIGICILIGKKQKTHYLLWIDNKQNRMKYNPDELIWLRTLANYIGIVYENLDMLAGIISEFELRNGQDSPAWVSRLVFRLAENERRRLASDLHDSALQDQLLWYRKFEDILYDNNFPIDVRIRMEEIKEGLLDVIHQIRQTCNELRPPFLKEMGAVEAIDQLCVNAGLNANFNIEFEHDQLDLKLDDEYVLMFYRITQELLRNTMKHASATEVELVIRNDDKTITYEYVDNGVGMDLVHSKSTSKNMGISGIRERVASLNGETIFQSAIGAGFKVTVILPIM